MVKDRYTTIGLRAGTKAKLNRNRAPGQSYDGFIRQLIELWEQSREKEPIYTAGPAKGGDMYRE